MALNIRNQETEKLASDLAALTGESKTEAVTKALKDRLDRMKRRRARRCLADRLDEIAKHCAALPRLDRRSPDEILYDEHGLPG
jgi:antitoxin VapB